MLRGQRCGVEILRVGCTVFLSASRCNSFGSATKDEGPAPSPDDLELRSADVDNE
jgi:hypothetical protein